MAHLWEAQHGYYCAEGHAQETFASWSDYQEAWPDIDMDYNLLFRWDWVDSNNLENEIGQDELHLFYVLQRKGVIISIVVRVEKSDEDSVIAFLAPRYRHLVGLWNPMQIQEAA